MINKKKIDLIVYDFDGVMTDNSLLMDQDGKEYVRVSRADGLAVSEIKKMFLKQIILSTESKKYAALGKKYELIVYKA